MRKLVLGIISAVMLWSCSTMKVSSDYDRTVDFSQHHTFSFIGWQDDSNELINKFDQRRLEEAFTEQFQKRGYTLVEENGDIEVSFFLAVDEKTGKTAYTTHMGGMYGYGYGWGYGYGYGYGMGSSYTTIEEYDYNVGTLVVDVFDGQSKQLIWQGVGSDTVIENPKERARKIPYFASNIMFKYPIRPGKRK